MRHQYIGQITFAYLGGYAVIGFATKLLFVCAVLSSFSATVFAADNQLTPDEKRAGWQLLFNGRDLSGWKNNDSKPLNLNVVKEGTINTRGIGGYLLVYDKQFDDFEFKCDVKMAEGECNSGIFVRTSDLADPVNTGLEVQIFSPPGDTVQDFGAIYDLVAPSKIATKGEGEWNNVEVRCVGPLISVKVNGEQVAELDCDTLDQPGLRADGTKHKFPRAIKDFARKGYIGLQDHGTDVWFKNLKLRELKETASSP
jgi:hypothetical protein